MDFGLDLSLLSTERQEEIARLSQEVNGLLMQATDLLPACDHVEWDEDCSGCSAGRRVRVDLARKQQQLMYVMQAAALERLTKRLRPEPLPWWKRVFGGRS